MKYLANHDLLKGHVFIALLIVLVFSSFAFAQASTETLTNQEVIAMLNAGIGPTVIINKIRTSKTRFDLSTSELIKLKQAGVTNEILEAMQGYSETADPAPQRPASMPSIVTSTAPPGPDPNDPMTRHEIGIYLYQTKNEQRSLIALEPAAVTRGRSGSKIATQLTYGIWVTKEKAKINGTQAPIQTKEPQPTFYFYLNEKDRTMAVVKYFPASVNQFQLVRFEVNDGGREVTVAKNSNYYGKTGIPNDRLVEFNIEKVGDGIYKVTPKEILKAGEYGFYLLGTGSGIGATFYDFSVQPVP